MLSFWLAIVVFIIIALSIVWTIFKGNDEKGLGAENKDIREETNITLYHEHLAQLTSDYNEGAIDQDSFKQLKTELDKTLIQDVKPNTDESTITQKKSLLWPITIAFTVVGFSLLAYMKLGAYQQLTIASDINSQAHQNLPPAQQLAFRIEQLQKQVQQQPDNAGAWFNLGQALNVAGQFQAAINAFDMVIQLVGEHAEILGVKAQAMYSQNNQQINEEIQQVIDKALALDSADASTNILLGMDSFSQGDYQKAINAWQTVVNSGRPGVNIQALTEAITEAKNQISISQSMAGNEQANSNTDQNEATAEQAVQAASIIVDVALAEAVKQQLAGQAAKTVFIYAIATQGPRMPLAALKIKTTDLPKRIILNDSQAMTPQMKLSSFEQVNVYAVVSMSGSAGVKSGDFKAEMKNINTGENKMITLEISQKVP